MYAYFFIETETFLLLEFHSSQWDCNSLIHERGGGHLPPFYDSYLKSLWLETAICRCWTLFGYYLFDECCFPCPRNKTCVANETKQRKAEKFKKIWHSQAKIRTTDLPITEPMGWPPDYGDPLVTSFISVGKRVVSSISCGVTYLKKFHIFYSFFAGLGNEHSNGLGNFVRL